MVKPVFENVIDMVGGLLKAEKKKKRKAKVAPAKFVSEENKPKSKVRARRVFPPYVAPALPFELPERRGPGRPPGPSKGKKAVLVAETAELDERKALSAEIAKKRESRAAKKKAASAERFLLSLGKEVDDRKRAAAIERARRGEAKEEEEFVDASAEAEPISLEGLKLKKDGTVDGRTIDGKAYYLARRQREEALGLSPALTRSSTEPRSPEPSPRRRLEAQFPRRASSEEAKAEELPFILGSGKFKKRK